MLLAAASAVMLTGCGSDATAGGDSLATSSTPNPAGEWAGSARGLAQEIADHGLGCATYKPGSGNSQEDWGTCIFTTSEEKTGTYTIGVFASEAMTDDLKKSDGFRKDGIWGPNWSIVCTPVAVCTSIQMQIGGTFN
ncbi:hypothetical protein G419_16430 [Rhodococcus triatomae BKS 15-14]|nr:hypothetical protein G419_16430 [Rhodococcus triatomae BKS 15-14]